MDEDLLDRVREELGALTGAPGTLLGRLAWSVVAVAVLLLLRWLLLRVLQRHIDDHETWYRTRKAVSYVALGLGLVALGRVWVAGLDTLVTVLGLIAAGLVISLGEVVRNLAGGVYIALRHPLRVGDRVEIDGVAGDVVNVGSFAFDVLEIRNWVDADQSTGRVVHLPNSLLFSRPLANFGAGFHWIWHEVTVPLTYESDWRRAGDILKDILERNAPDVAEAEAAESLRRAARDYLITYTHLSPTVYVDADERGIRLTGRLLCDVRQRRGMSAAIWTEFLDAAAGDPGIEFAYPPVRAYLHHESGG